MITLQDTNYEYTGLELRLFLNRLVTENQEPSLELTYFFVMKKPHSSFKKTLVVSLASFIRVLEVWDSSCTLRETVLNIDDAGICLLINCFDDFCQISFSIDAGALRQGIPSESGPGMLLASDFLNLKAFVDKLKHRLDNLTK